MPTGRIGSALAFLSAPTKIAEQRNIMTRTNSRFAFDGGAGTYLGTAILGALITICTLGICYPFAVVLLERWKAAHSFIDGQQLSFSGSAMGLFGHWIKWELLSIVTLGIYAFWVVPRLTQWKWENTGFAVQGGQLGQPIPPVQVFVGR